MDYNALNLPAKNVRDVSKIGHYGTGDTEILITSLADLENAKQLIEESYKKVDL